MPSVAAIALLVRVAMALVHRNTPLQFDAGDYDRHARSIAAGHGFPVTVLAAPGTPSGLRPPAYPYLLAAVYRVTGDSPLAGRILGAVLGTIAVVLLFVIVKRIWGTRLATIVGLMAAIFPPLVAVNASLISEALFIPLVLAVALLLLHMRSERACAWTAAATGCVCGLAALTRTNGLLLAVPAVLAVACLWQLTIARRVFLSALVLGSMIAVVAPWVVHNAFVFNRTGLITTSDGFNLYGEYNPVSVRASDAPWIYPPQLPAVAPLLHRPGIDESNLNQTLGHWALDTIARHPEQVPKAILWNSLRLVDLGGPAGLNQSSLQEMGIGQLGGVVVGSAWVLVALAIAGAVVLARTRLRGPLWLWVFPVVLWLSVVPVAGSLRYRTPIDVFLLILAAFPVERAWVRLGRWRSEQKRGVQEDTTAVVPTLT